MKRILPFDLIAILGVDLRKRLQMGKDLRKPALAVLRRMPLGIIDRAMHSLRRKRLQDVVRRMPLECRHRVLVECRDKDDRRHSIALATKSIHHLHPRHLRHPDIDEQDVVGVVANAAQRLNRIHRHIHYFNVRTLSQHSRQRLASQRLIIYNKNTHESMTSFPVRTAEPSLSLPRNWYSKKPAEQALLPQSCLCDETVDAHRSHTGAIAVSGYSGGPPPFPAGSRRLRCSSPQALAPARLCVEVISIQAGPRQLAIPCFTPFSISN